MITIKLTALDARLILQRLQESDGPVLVSFIRLAESIEHELEIEHDD